MIKTIIKLNEDSDLVDQIRSAIRANDGYCICATEKTPDTKCMCKEFRNMTLGECHCGLYTKVVVSDDK